MLPRSILFPYTTLFRSIRLSPAIPAWHSRSRHARDSRIDRKSTRLNSSHVETSYAVFCLKKKQHRTSLQLARAIKHRGKQERARGNTLRRGLSLSRKRACVCVFF